MRKVIFLLISIFIIGVNAEAKSTKKARSSKKATTSALAVTKGEKKSYGDYLTTQLFSIKKGKGSKIVVEYPISGNKPLVEAMRKYIKNSLDANFTGSLDTPEALLRSVMKGKRDVSFGQEGESLEQELKIVLDTPEIITLSNEGYLYAGGAHGSSWKSGSTFLVSNGKELNSSMFPNFSKMKPYILTGLAEYFDVPKSQLDSCIDDVDRLDYPGTIIITRDGINFIYQEYEIAPWAAGIPVAVVEPNDEIISLMKDEGKIFLQSYADIEFATVEGVFFEIDENGEKLYMAPEKMAEFPGGEAALFNWLSNNIVYPEKALENSIQGMVMVQFIIEKDGTLTNVTIFDSVDKDIDNEVLRVVKKMPEWTPAKVDGKKVRSLFNLPITFRLTDDD